MSGFREFSRSDKSRPSSLKEFDNLPFSAMRKPSLKYFLKTELDWVTSQGNIFLTRLTTGICCPLLTGGFRFYRICRHEPGDSKVSFTRGSYFRQGLRGHRLSHSFFPFATSCGSTLSGPNHGASASVAERQSVTLRWLLS